MKKYLTLLMAIIIFASCADSKREIVKFEKVKVDYLETRMDSVVDDYHGTNVSDPYRWLEDDDSDETKSWVVGQNKSTFDYLSKIPYRNDIKERLEEVWNYAKYSSPFKEGDTYYYYKNDGLQNQYVMYGSKDIKTEGEVVLDPNKFSEDGTSSLAGTSFDKSGRYLASI
jgi:prolyl oligopeptidase